MKYFLIMLFLGTVTSVLHAQTQSQSFGNSFNSIAGASQYERIQLTGGNYFQKANLVSNNDVVLPSYVLNGEGADNTYFSKDWVEGSVTTKDNQTYSGGLVFMFNKVNSQLYFRKADSATVMEADMNKISLFSLITDKPHIFIKGDLLNKEQNDEIFKILILDQKGFSFLKSIISNYQQPSGNSAAQALTQTQTPGKYVDNPVYYIYKNNALQQTQLKKKEFLKALDPDELKAGAYTQSHKGNFNETYAVNLIIL